MKKGALIGLAFLVGLFFSFSAAQAGPVVKPGVYESQAGDFTTKFWEEKFIGGGPGQPGNVLMAVGQGFVFQYGTLDSVVRSDDKYGDYEWQTTYTGGVLILNSQGPWLEKGKLIAKDITATAKDITATNYSKVERENLKFLLKMEGSFEDTPYSFTAEVTYEGTPDTYWVKYDEDGNPTFHGGTNYNVVINIF